VFDIGFTELMLLGVVALLILGPERLPAAARTAGALLRRARNSYQSLKTDIERELAVDEMKASAKAMQEPLQSIKDTAAELNRGAANLRDELKRSDPIAKPASVAPAAKATAAEKVAAAEEDALALGPQVQAAPGSDPEPKLKADPNKPKAQPKPKVQPKPKAAPKPKPEPAADKSEKAADDQ